MSLWLQGPYPGSHAVGVYLYCTGVIPVEARGHTPHALPILSSSFFIGCSAFHWNCVLSMHVAGHPEESITLLRLMVLASFRLLLVLEGVFSLMSVLSMLRPLPTERV